MRSCSNIQLIEGSARTCCLVGTCRMPAMTKIVPDILNLEAYSIHPTIAAIYLSWIVYSKYFKPPNACPLLETNWKLSTIEMTEVIVAIICIDNIPWK